MYSLMYICSISIYLSIYLSISLSIYIYIERERCILVIITIITIILTLIIPPGAAGSAELSAQAGSGAHRDERDAMRYVRRDTRDVGGHGPPRATGHGPRATGHGPRATGHGPRATGHGPRATTSVDETRRDATRSNMTQPAKT